MKTIFKSLLYFSFAGLILTGCAKNDDFSVPNVKCEDKDIAANKALGEIYGLTDQTMKKYEEDHVISGTVISSDRGGNFYREIYFVSDDNKFAGVFKADIKGSYAKYELGSQIFIKLKDVHVQQNNGVLAIGAPDTDPKKTFISYLADPTYKKFIVKGCNRISPEEVTKKFATELTLKEAAADANIGKLVTLTDVQFTADVRGKVFWSKDRPAPGNATLNKIEGKNGNPTADVVFRVVEQSSDFAGKIIPNKSGKMTGVMTKFGVGANLVYQFVPRFWEDLQLDQDTFEGSTPSEPEKPEEPAEDIKVEPGKFLAFPGADFEDWKAFTSVIFKNALSDPMASEAKNQGWENSTGLAIKGKREKNGFLFSVEGVKVPADATKVSFLMKGKADKSLSINLYKANGKNFYAYNLIEDDKATPVFTASKTLSPNMKETNFGQGPTGDTTNKYYGKIDTKGEWVKVILDLTPLKGDFHTAGTGSFIGFRNGNAAEYDLVIDEIRFEDGTPVAGGEKPTDPEKPGEGGEKPGEVKDPITLLGKTGNLTDIITTNPKNNNGITLTQVDGKTKKSAIEIKGESGNNAAGFSIPNVLIPANAKNIVFYVKGTSTQGGKDGDRGAFVVNTLKVDNNIAGHFSIKNALNGASGTITVKGVNDNKNDYAGKIDAKDWVKVILPLQDMIINDTGKGGFVQFRFAKDGTFNVIIDNISFE